MVLAREFSISDSANPFYLKLRNSILPVLPLAAPAGGRSSPSRHEGIHPRDFSTPLGIPCPRPVFAGRLRSSRQGDERFYIFSNGQPRSPSSPSPPTPPARIFRARDIGQQKLKSSMYSRKPNNGRSFISREIARCGNTPCLGWCTGRYNEPPTFSVFL